MTRRRVRRSLRRALLPAALATAAALSAPSAAAAAFGDETLSKGDSGADVRGLQRALNDAYDTTVDGEFGRHTLKRVRAFEGNEQLRVDGKVTPSDAEVLEEAAERGPDGEEEPPGSDEDVTPDGPDEVSGSKATLNDDGLAIAPADAPEEVKQVIEAGNEIAEAPYEYGGGHGEQLKDSGYDCSGSMSYVLRKAELLESALASGGFESYGDAGPGEWITTYANSGHSYLIVAGLRFDTSARKRSGTRWSDEARSSRGYVVRHPEGF